MGINNLLPKILPSAGRENYDLRALSDGLIESLPSRGGGGGDGGELAAKKQRMSWSRRRVRIAVDVNGWIARAAHGYGGTLVDERHLSYHGRAQLRNERRRQQRQQQQQAEEGGGGPSGANGDNDSDAANPPPADGNEQIQRQQRLEYVTNCISFVLQRIEYLRDECRADVLPVLDGATPPCKKDAVRERSDRRRRAEEERDEVASSPRRRPGSNQNVGGENEEGRNEAARTEAEVLRRISASKVQASGHREGLLHATVHAGRAPRGVSEAELAVLRGTIRGRRAAGLPGQHRGRGPGGHGGLGPDSAGRPAW